MITHIIYDLLIIVPLSHSSCIIGPIKMLAEVLSYGIFAVLVLILCAIMLCSCAGVMLILRQIRRIVRLCLLTFYEFVALLFLSILYTYLYFNIIKSNPKISSIPTPILPYPINYPIFINTITYQLYNEYHIYIIIK